MLGSLYGDLPQAKNTAAQEEAAKAAKQNSWTPSSLAPPTRKPSVLGAPPSVLRAGRGKPTSATQRQQAIKRENSDPATTSISAGAARAAQLLQPAAFHLHIEFLAAVRMSVMLMCSSELLLIDWANS